MQIVTAMSQLTVRNIIAYMKKADNLEYPGLPVFLKPSHCYFGSFVMAIQIEPSESIFTRINSVTF